MPKHPKNRNDLGDPATEQVVGSALDDLHDQQESKLSSPFSYREKKNGRVDFYRGGRWVLALGERESTKFLSKVKGLADAQAQILMASATGQYKFGNERLARTKRSN